MNGNDLDRDLETAPAECAPLTGPKAIVTAGPNPEVLGIGETHADAWSDARLRAAEAGALTVTLDAAVCVDATPAALRAWAETDYAEPDPCPAYLAPDGVVRLPRNEGCTEEAPCRSCIGCIYELEPDHDEEVDERYVCQHEGPASRCGQLIRDGHHVGLGGGIDHAADADHRARGACAGLDERCLVSRSPMQGRSAANTKQFLGADDVHGSVLIPLADVAQPNARNPIIGIEVHKTPPDAVQPEDGNWLGYSPVWADGAGYETDDIHESLAELCADYDIPVDLVLDRMAVALLRRAAPEPKAPALIVLPSGQVIGSGADELHAWADARLSRGINLEGTRCVALTDVPGAGQPGGPCITAPGVPCSCDDCIAETSQASTAARATDDDEGAS